jgi:hypothetical protein
MRPFRTGAWLVCAALALTAGCNRNKGEEATPSAEPQKIPDDQAGLVEERDDGKLEWVVQEDGAVRVKVTLNEGTTPALSGVLLVDGQSYQLTASGAALTTAIPKLGEGLTTITYSLKVGEATWDGSLHVPQGGTKELIAVPTVSVPEGTKGPHGGAVDVIGDQRVEIVVDEKTGEVRMYMLDDKLQPIPVGSASAVVGFQQAPDGKPQDPQAQDPKPQDPQAQDPKPQETK